MRILRAAKEYVRYVLWRAKGVWGRPRDPRADSSRGSPSRSEPEFHCVVTGLAGAGTSLVSALLAEALEADAVVDESALRWPVGWRMRPLDTHLSLDNYRKALEIRQRRARTEASRMLVTMIAAGHHSTVVEKMPNLGLLLGSSILGQSPAARRGLVLVHRDVRAVLAGWITKWALLAEEDFTSICEFAVWMYEEAADELVSAPAAVIIKYEDVVAGPAEAIGDALVGLGLATERLASVETVATRRDWRQTKGFVDETSTGPTEIAGDRNARAISLLTREQLEMATDAARRIDDIVDAFRASP